MKRRVDRDGWAALMFGSAILAGFLAFHFGGNGFSLLSANLAGFAAAKFFSER